MWAHIVQVEYSIPHAQSKWVNEISNNVKPPSKGLVLQKNSSCRVQGRLSNHQIENNEVDPVILPLERNTSYTLPFL
jgi:hypothetical protein